MPTQKNKHGLTPKQQRFCDEYLVDLNGTQAAIRAGYSKNSATEIAVENLAKPLIKDYVNKRKQDRLERSEGIQDKVVKELAAIAFADVTKVAEVIEGTVHDKEGNPYECKTVDVALTEVLDTDTKKAIASIKEGRNGIEIKMYDKVKALDKLAEHLGMYNKERTKIERERLELERKRYELEVKKTEAGTPDKDVEISIGGYKEEWSE